MVHVSGGKRRSELAETIPRWPQQNFDGGLIIGMYGMVDYLASLQVVGRP